MISHTLITIAGFALYLPLLWFLDADPLLAGFMACWWVGVWYSREKSQEEVTVGSKTAWRTIAPWKWDKWNGDFTVPSTTAIAIAGVWVADGGPSWNLLLIAAALAVMLPMLFWLRGDDRAFYRLDYDEATKRKP
jgi:hypothetical protein